MTDIYAEEVLIDKFLDLYSLCEELLVKDYYNTHIQDLEKYAKDDIEFLTWYNTYISLPKEEHNEEDDLLLENIRNHKLPRYLKYDEDGDVIYSNFPAAAFPNSDFERPVDENGNNTAWYELFFITSKPNQIELGTTARSRWIGIMQINICIPKTWGRKEINYRYNEIADLFRSGINIDGVRVTNTYRTSALDDDDYYCLPVTVEWWADLDR